MNLLKKMMVSTLFFAGLLCAKTIDLYFDDAVSPSLTTNSSVIRQGSFPKIRLRVIDPPSMGPSTYGFYLEKPFFIIDGIHLSTDENRTLSQLQHETAHRHPRDVEILRLHADSCSIYRNGHSVS